MKLGRCKQRNRSVANAGKNPACFFQRFSTNLDIMPSCKPYMSSDKLVQSQIKYWPTWSNFHVNLSGNTKKIKFYFAIHVATRPHQNETLSKLLNVSKHTIQCSVNKKPFYQSSKSCLTNLLQEIFPQIQKNLSFNRPRTKVFLSLDPEKCLSFDKNGNSFLTFRPSFSLDLEQVFPWTQDKSFLRSNTLQTSLTI